MTQIYKNIARLIPRATAGDPTALALLAALGVCALGKYIYDTVKDS
ncbi:MAG: hypothetical protein IJW46_04170 [Clostridia bacterium]|nr:hypothetical protein [Clostridia bacterium]